MSRLIDADALVEDLILPTKQFEKGFKELIGDAPTIDPSLIVGGKHPNWTIESAVEYLQNCGWMVEHDKALTQQWIPVSEKLPEKYGWYQVTLKDGRVSRLYYDYKGDRWIDNVRKHMFELYDIYSKITHKRITEKKEDVYWDDCVIAWMELPEPYKAESEDKE